MNTRYVIVTPVRNEEVYLRFTIESVTRQSVLPVEWVIVDDGSTDGTPEIIEGYSQRYPWIRAVYRKDRGFRKPGGGVVEAFNEGYAALGCRDWDFIVKLDGDLSFEADYFEKCFAHFEREPRLGVGGGAIFHIQDREMVMEGGPTFHVRGATKIYRRAVWEGMGGFWPAPGWDTIDEVKANMLGWTTRSFLELPVIHHRFTGAADGRWRNLVKNGRSDYICGYHPLFMLAKCIYRFHRKPYIIGSVGLLYGFLRGYLKRIPQVNDPAMIRYLRRQQLGRLFGRETVWK